MPQDLAALLVEEGAVSQADMERALARQAQLGGALDTALLELELIGEAALLAYLSTASGLPAAPDAAFKEVDPRARRVFPAKVAERHRLGEVNGARRCREERGDLRARPRAQVHGIRRWLGTPPG